MCTQLGKEDIRRIVNSTGVRAHFAGWPERVEAVATIGTKKTKRCIGKVDVISQLSEEGLVALVRTKFHMEREAPMHITGETAKALQFKKYRKGATTRASVLTRKDHEGRDGVIQTLEGPVSFEVGDYLCQGVEGEEWPMKPERFKECYEWIGVYNPTTGLYRSKGFREAVQIDEDFTVRRNANEMCHGKPGDYLVRQGEKLWIVDAGIFEASYEKVEEP